MRGFGVGLVLLSGVLAGKSLGSVTVHVLAGPVTLKHQSPVQAGVEAMPVVEAGRVATAEVAAKINAAFRRVDARVRSAAADCVGTSPGKQGEWTRTVEVTMLGPRYLSLVATDEFFCGGAHPDAAVLPLVYDLETGGTVNWLKLLPPGVTSGVDDAADGNKVGAVIWPVLTEKARAQAEKGCAELFDPAGAVPFVLWLDARAGAIKARPYGLPAALKACAVPVGISVEEARGLGFRVEVVDALEAARGLQK